MRARSLLAASAVAASLALALPPALAAAAPQQAQAAPACREAKVKLKVAKTDKPHVFRLTVRNDDVRACRVDRVPTITFGNLDGAAQPVSSATSRTHTLAAGATAHAKVRTIKRPGDPLARTVRTVHVITEQRHRGTSFTARTVSGTNRVTVYDPVTTWWHGTQGGADRQLNRAR
jgi:hypothetical protein